MVLRQARTAAMLSDTHPDAERVQIELLRKMTVAERLRLADDLTSVTCELSRRALTAANSGISSRELEWKVIELYYGREVARRLRCSAERD
jgi:hypothetical protein